MDHQANGQRPSEGTVGGAEGGSGSGSGSGAMHPTRSPTHPGDTTQQDNTQQDNTQQLSKNALKRLKRKEHNEKVKQLKKQQERERKAKAKEDKLALIAERNAGLSEEEIRADREARQARARAHRAEQVKEKEERAARLKKAKEDGEYRVVIDYDFEAYMTEAEIRSIVQQTNFSYGANGRAAVPVHLILTSIKGKIKDQFEKQLCGMPNWHGVTVAEAPYTELLKDELDKVTYLTADSEDEIRELRAGEVYVIGGIVDRNRHKNLCFERAKEAGVKTGRLPIGQAMVAGGRSVVMTTNHVVDMLLGRLAGQTWEAVVDGVLPDRKRKQQEDQQEANGK